MSTKSLLSLAAFHSKIFSPFHATASCIRLTIPRKDFCRATLAQSYIFIPERKPLWLSFQEPDGYTVAIADVLPSQMRPATQEDLDNDRFWKRESV